MAPRSAPRRGMPHADEGGHQPFAVLDDSCNVVRLYFVPSQNGPVAGRRYQLGAISSRKGESRGRCRNLAGQGGKPKPWIREKPCAMYTPDAAGPFARLAVPARGARVPIQDPVLNSGPARRPPARLPAGQTLCPLSRPTRPKPGSATALAAAVWSPGPTAWRR
jgi:hypothetical protein